ncbi:hypothetical protein KYI07_12515 (plasmid) [Macrococcus psychrotolerans]|uniref:Pathogenicity island protein n=1 Tax=Macrococcus psychrotolerans TaxID=3039389 RepID=A0AAT9P8N7_9STAP|nr:MULTISPECIES: hypothetical protein [Macrococcus]QYA34230.1 hypothetical protein KYI10_12560 [Macrococcus sp. 19Msa1099]QYA39027.1 hypothetical protein KYI07_12515 [Macrococcus caseolyticus]QYA77752.1 hypothetical protein KYI12_12610 [Macrococcus caseolyticus]
MKKQVLKTVLSLSVLTALGTSEFQPYYAHAEAITNAQVKMVKLDQHTFGLKLKNVQAVINADGSTVLKDMNTKKVETLPSEAIDEYGNKVKIAYKKVGKDLIGQYQLIEDGGLSFYAAKKKRPSGAKCGFGVIGSYYTGMIGGAASGAAVGSLGGPIGAVGGAITLGLLGSYAGASVGYASYC